jgi:hypothetical protein
VCRRDWFLLRRIGFTEAVIGEQRKRDLKMRITNIGGDGFDRRFRAASTIRLKIFITGFALSPPLAKTTTPTSSFGRNEASVENPGTDPV